MNVTAPKRGIDVMEKILVYVIKVVNKNDRIESKSNIPACILKPSYGC